MITYGGVELVVPENDDVRARVLDLISTAELEEFQAPEWTGFSELWQIPEYGPQRKIRLGRLFWPRGASVWATAHLVATEEQLDRIRTLAYKPDSRAVVPLDLVIWDASTPAGGGKITASMYLTPPRPLFQWDNL